MSAGLENAVLGRVFQWGSITGIAVSFGAMLSLLLRGEAPQALPLAAAFEPGARLAERALCGAGILLLALTPLLGLGYLLGQASRTGNARRLRLALGIFALCALAVATTFSSR